MSFWIVSAVLMLLAVGLLFLPLLRAGANRDAGRDVDREAQNVAIARERLRELDAERERGDIDDAAYDKASAELRRALAEDLDPTQQAAVRSNPWPLGLSLLILVPAIATGLYFRVGAPEHLQMVGANAGADNPHVAQGELPPVGEMIAQLEARLAEEPDNAEGWFILGRTYMAMNRYADAAGAFRRLRHLTGDHPTVLVSLADAVAMTQQGQIAGEPEQLVLKALQSEPENPVALWLAGQAAMEGGRSGVAVDYWRRAKAVIDDPQRAAQLQNMIAAAEQAGGDSGGEAAMAVQPQPDAAPAAAVTAASIRVAVSLSDELRAKVGRDVPVFVFATAVEGPPMPLAVARLTVGDLPAEVTLDDSMAMMPQMKLSSFEQVQLTARVALSGRPIAQSGDFESDSRVVGVSQAGEPVSLAIVRTVP